MRNNTKYFASQPAFESYPTLSLEEEAMLHAEISSDLAETSQIANAVDGVTDIGAGIADVAEIIPDHTNISPAQQELLEVVDSMACAATDSDICISEEAFVDDAKTRIMKIWEAIKAFFQRMWAHVKALAAKLGQKFNAGKSKAEKLKAEAEKWENYDKAEAAHRQGGVKRHQEFKNKTRETPFRGRFELLCMSGEKQITPRIAAMLRDLVDLTATTTRDFADAMKMYKAAIKKEIADLKISRDYSNASDRQSAGINARFEVMNAIAFGISHDSAADRPAISRQLPKHVLGGLKVIGGGFSDAQQKDHAAKIDHGSLVSTSLRLKVVVNEPNEQKTVTTLPGKDAHELVGHIVAYWHEVTGNAGFQHAMAEMTTSAAEMQRELDNVLKLEFGKDAMRPTQGVIDELKSYNSLAATFLPQLYQHVSDIVNAVGDYAFCTYTYFNEMEAAYTKEERDIEAAHAAKHPKPEGARPS